MNLSENVKISQAITVTDGAAGTTDINGATLDMSGHGCVLMAVTFGAIVFGAVTSIKAQQGAASDMSDAADLAGSAQTIADDDDEKTFYIEIVRPTKRYVRLVVDRGYSECHRCQRYVFSERGQVCPCNAWLQCERRTAH